MVNHKKEIVFYYNWYQIATCWWLILKKKKVFSQGKHLKLPGGDNEQNKTWFSCISAATSASWGQQESFQDQFQFQFRS